MRRLLTASLAFLLLLLVLAAAARIGGGEITFKVKGARSVVFSHESHVSAYELRCTSCHDSLFLTRAQHRKVTMKEMAQGKACGACHNGKQAFSVKDKSQCSTCHSK